MQRVLSLIVILVTVATPIPGIADTSRPDWMPDRNGNQPPWMQDFQKQLDAEQACRVYNPTQPPTTFEEAEKQSKLLDANSEPENLASFWKCVSHHPEFFIVSPPQDHLPSDVALKERLEAVDDCVSKANDVQVRMPSAEKVGRKKEIFQITFQNCLTASKLFYKKGFEYYQAYGRKSAD